MKFFWQKTQRNDGDAPPKSKVMTKPSGVENQADYKETLPYPVSRFAVTATHQVTSSLTAAESHEMLSVVGRYQVRHTVSLYQASDFTVAYDTDTFELLMRWHKSTETGWFAVPPLFHQVVIERLQDFRKTPHVPKSLKPLFDVPSHSSEGQNYS